MYRRCYRYDDRSPIVTHIADQEDTPSIMHKETREALEAQPYEVVPTKEASSEKETVSHTNTVSPEKTKDASYIESMTKSLRQLYGRARGEIMKNGKVFGIMEIDDVVIILLIVLLLAEDSDDYILLLALAALLFIK